MGLCLKILVTVVALVFGVSTLSTGTVVGAAKSSVLTHPIVSGSNTMVTRLLRSNGKDEVDEGAKRFYGEERANGFLSNLASLLHTPRKVESKVMRWADADKSDDFVKQKLKLDGLSGDALKSNKNYKYFKQFVDIKEGNQRDVWLKQEASTSDVWTKLGFGNVKTQEELTKASGTDAFQVYLRYADSVDNRAVAKSYNKEKIVPVISVDSSWAEKTVRMESWVKANKSAAYVMMVLGLHNLSPAAVKSNKNLKLFVEYLQMNKKSLGNADILLKHLMGLENLSPKAMANSENYKTYKTLSDLIQNNK